MLGSDHNPTIFDCEEWQSGDKDLETSVDQAEEILVELSKMTAEFMLKQKSKRGKRTTRKRRLKRT